MKFQDYAALIEQQLWDMANKYPLFRSSLPGTILWDTYLSNFRPGDNPVFRDPESSEHNCNLDHAFIKRYGNIVAIDENYNIITMFDLDIPESSKYYQPNKAMQAALGLVGIQDAFTETYSELNSLPYESLKRTQSKYKLGFKETFKTYTEEEASKFGVVTPDIVYKFYHFYGTIPAKYVDASGKSESSIIAEYRDTKSVLMRGLEEISLDTLELVKDLIEQNSLLNGESYLPKLTQFINLKKAYLELDQSKRANWAWVTSLTLKSRFRNELIGTLCVEIESGIPLNDACLNWNKRADPVNYMKATAPISKKQIEDAKKFVLENGYEASFNRRFATIEDINISEILHVHNSASEQKVASIFDSVKPTTVKKESTLKSMDNVKEVSIQEFLNDYLSKCNSLEVLLEGRYKSNLVTMTTDGVPNAKPIFKWTNNFSWTYNGNLAGKSLITQAVKSAGGSIDGVLRFSIMWNENGNDIVDLDAHAHVQNGSHIYFGNQRDWKSKGELDIDMICPKGLGVENIVWKDIHAINNDVIELKINNFDKGRNTGFKAEVVFNGITYAYHYDGVFMGTKAIATVTIKNGEFSIKHEMPCAEETSTEMWGLKTLEFQKVNLVCQSPNYWGTNNIGNRHYFFMLEGCHSDTAMRSFHTENLNSDLLLHRKVMEVLGETTKLTPNKAQLAGVGFNSTIKDDLIVRYSLRGDNSSKLLKIKF